MLHVYEFEIFEDESGALIVKPFNMDGATSGTDFRDACEMAADWLQTEMEHRAVHDIPYPEPTFGNEPNNGGKVVIVAVDADRDTVRKVSASEAARMLGVTPGRVTQMVKAGQLEAFKDGHSTWVTLGSIEARLAESPKAGRPKRTVNESASK